MRRRKNDKLVADSDSDFALNAKVFAETIGREPERYRLTREAAEEIESAVAAFRAALAAAIHRATRNVLTTMRKNEARQRAEKVVRKFANIIRADDRIERGEKRIVKVKEWEKRPRASGRPTSAPTLHYLRSEGSFGDFSGRHVVSFEGLEKFTSVNKPAGAARLELFVELVQPGEPIPRASGPRPWYLRSFTRSPMKVEFPVSSTPMMVVYWGRWANNAGEYGPMSATCVARVEGWGQSQQHIRITQAVQEARRIEHQAQLMPESKQLEHLAAQRLLMENRPAATTTMVVAVKREETSELG